MYTEFQFMCLFYYKLILQSFYKKITVHDINKLYSGRHFMCSRLILITYYYQNTLTNLLLAKVYLLLSIYIFTLNWQ